MTPTSFRNVKFYDWYMEEDLLPFLTCMTHLRGLEYVLLEMKNSTAGSYKQLEIGNEQKVGLSCAVQIRILDCFQSLGSYRQNVHDHSESFFKKKKKNILSVLRTCEKKTEAKNKQKNTTIQFHS